MPVTSSSSSLHTLSEKVISNFELGVNLLAAIKVLAQCEYVVSHTGNVSLWIFLYRGSQGIVGNFGPEPLSARHVTTKIGRCDEVSKDGRGE